jgi:hypothetical protein
VPDKPIRNKAAAAITTGKPAAAVPEVTMTRIVAITNPTPSEK